MGISKTLPIASLILLAAIGCAKPMPTGPLFTGLHPPGADNTRVYLYRSDTHHSYSIVEIRFDGENPIRIRDEEYASVELGAGIHEVEFRLSNAIWGGWRWRRQVLRARPGETLYMEIDVGIDQQPLAPGGDLQIAGRATGTAGESVSIRLQERRNALEILSRSHRIESAKR